MITGGCGFLGSNITAAVIRQGHDVTVFDNLSRHGSDSNLEWLRNQGSFNFVHGDIRHADDCDQLLSAYRPDAIFHLAGQVAMTTSLMRPRLDFEINALGSLNILESVRKYCPRTAIVYSSSNKVYGDLEHLQYREKESRYEIVGFDEGLPETMGLDFHSPYGCSKGSADQYMLDFSRMYGLRTVVFRHSSMYGGRQFSTVDQGWIGWFCAQAIRQSGGDHAEFTISGNGKQVRDVLYSDDMVDLYLAAAERAESVAGQAFNIGGGMTNSLSVIELMFLLEEITGHKLSWRHIKPRESDQRVFVADIRKAKELLNWSPKISKQEGVRRMIGWVASLKK